MPVLDGTTLVDSPQPPSSTPPDYLPLPESVVNFLAPSDSTGPRDSRSLTNVLIGDMFNLWKPRLTNETEKDDIHKRLMDWFSQSLAIPDRVAGVYTADAVHFFYELYVQSPNQLSAAQRLEIANRYQRRVIISHLSEASSIQFKRNTLHADYLHDMYLETDEEHERPHPPLESDLSDLTESDLDDSDVDMIGRSKCPPLLRLTASERCSRFGCTFEDEYATFTSLGSSSTAEAKSKRFGVCVAGNNAFLVIHNAIIHGTISFSTSEVSTPAGPRQKDPPLANFLPSLANVPSSAAADGAKS
ncbi:hypothetical protein BDZ89DRAFT_1131925 [Hymenopellis radicata]|nr:hypothetical protein BDZ89DRAFT_1131925 [Hymenopellis radicata]